MTGLDWIIIGGESGPNFRPMDLDWAAQVARQAVAGGVPAVFMKQPSGFRNEAAWPALYQDHDGNLAPLPILRDPPPWPRKLL